MCRCKFMLGNCLAYFEGLFYPENILLLHHLIFKKIVSPNSVY